MQQPNPLAITALCIGGAALLVFLFWLNHVLRTGGKRTERKTVQAPPWISLGLSYLLGGSGPVKSLEGGAPAVMSYEEERPPENTLSSQRQTAPQTDRHPTAPSLPRDVMLDIYRLLRAHNVPREKARPALKAAGIPLDNNLWTEAAPPEEESEYSTPIAGRTTKATFHPDDPALEYQPPPR